VTSECGSDLVQNDCRGWIKRALNAADELMTMEVEVQGIMPYWPWGARPLNIYLHSKL